MEALCDYCVYFYITIERAIISIHFTTWKFINFKTMQEISNSIKQ